VKSPRPTLTLSLTRNTVARKRLGIGDLESNLILNYQCWWTTMTCRPRRPLSVSCPVIAMIVADGNASTASNPLTSCDLIILQCRKLLYPVSLRSIGLRLPRAWHRLGQQIPSYSTKRDTRGDQLESHTRTVIYLNIRLTVVLVCLSSSLCYGYQTSDIRK
jgi:hypothetical protein